jgi:hypothetical protein
MAKVRLKNHMVLADGSFVKRNSIIDDKLVPEKLRDQVDYEDLAGREGKVMVLHETRYEEKRMLNGHPAWFPTTIQAGELVERKLLPSILKEGIHFVTEWDEQMRAKARYEEEEREQKLLQPEPLKTYETTLGWKVK